MSDIPAFPPRPKRGRPRKDPTPEKTAASEADLYESRVDYVANLMRELKFIPGKTTKLLAQYFGISYAKASKISVEAGRRVRKELEEHGPLMAMAFRTLYHVVEDAMNAGDRHAMIKAVQLLAQLSGAGAPQRVAIAPDLAALTPEQLQARKAELLARIQEGAIVASLPAKSEDEGDS